MSPFDFRLATTRHSRLPLARVLLKEVALVRAHGNQRALDASTSGSRRLYGQPGFKEAYAVH